MCARVCACVCGACVYVRVCDGLLKNDRCVRAPFHSTVGRQKANQFSDERKRAEQFVRPAAAPTNTKESEFSCARGTLSTLRDDRKGIKLAPGKLVSAVASPNRVAKNSLPPTNNNEMDSRAPFMLLGARRKLQKKRQQWAIIGFGRSIGGRAQTCQQLFSASSGTKRAAH